MPVPPPPSQELDRRRETIEACLNEGYAPLSEHGGKGSAVREAAKRLGINPTTLTSNVKDGHILPDWSQYKPPELQRFAIDHPGKLDLHIEDGVVLIGSDCHYWPGIVSTAHRALVKACNELLPKAIIMNGDVLDGASISRHAPINWEERPTVEQEIETCQDRMGEITKAAGNAQRYWTLGNHDSRFEARLAAVAPEFAEVYGTSLHHHFPDWSPCWTVWINDDVVVKHRFKGGIHAPHNNTLWAGKSIVTGHLHSLKVIPVSDYNGTRYGVDGGSLADPYGPQFEYTELNPVSWRSGFVVLTFHKGMLLWPELVAVLDKNHVQFRGRVRKV